MQVTTETRPRSTARYLQAITGVAQATLEGAEEDAVFARIVREARLLVHARSAIIGTLGPHAGMLTVRGHDGARAHLIRPGAELPLEGSLAVPVIRTARTLVLSEPAPAPYADVVARFGLGPVMCVPLLAGGRVFGVMAVAQSPGGPAFGRARIALIEAFAGQAAVALEFQRVRHELRSLAVVEERERIARDLHDGAIQALFGLGMEVDSLAREASQAAECGALTRAVDCLEEAIRSLRSVIGRLVPAPS